MPTTMRFSLDFSGQGSLERARLVTELLTRVDPDEHDVRTRLLTILASSLVFSDPDAARSAAEEAQREGRIAGDAVSHAWMLMASSVVDVSPNGVQQRLLSTSEVLRLAQATGQSEFVPTAYFLHLSALAELGMIAELDQALNPTGQLHAAFPWLAEERHAAWFRCLRATIDGQADRAELIAHEALKIATEHGDPDAQAVWVGQLAIIRWMQGRVVELEPAFLQARQESPHEPVWAVSLAWMWLRQGRRSAARSLILSLSPFAELPIDRNWLSTTCILAVVLAELGETEAAAVVGEALQPFEDRLVTIGLGVTCWGTVSRPLALIAKSLGDTDAAIEHYLRAIEMAGKIGAHPWLAEAQLELAAILTDQPEAGRRHEARTLVDEAVATSRTLKLHGIERAASVLLDSLNAAAHTHRFFETNVARQSVPKIYALGTFEVVSNDGSIAGWQSRKARQLLKILVAQRGFPIARDTLMHLLWPDEAPSRLSNRFSVALSTVRRALDPRRVSPSDTYLQYDGAVVRLCVERIDIDLERFFAETSRTPASAALSASAGDKLREALQMYRGEVFGEQLEESWAEQLRTEVDMAFFGAAHDLAEASQAMGDELTRLECYRRILDIDEYDQRAHEGLIDALSTLGAHGQAATAKRDYQQKMDELDISTS